MYSDYIAGANRQHHKVALAWGAAGVLVCAVAGKIDSMPLLATGLMLGSTGIFGAYRLRPAALDDDFAHRMLTLPEDKRFIVPYRVYPFAKYFGAVGLAPAAVFTAAWFMVQDIQRMNALHEMNSDRATQLDTIRPASPVLPHGISVPAAPR